MNNVPVHDGFEAVDDLISDIHQLIDEKPAQPEPSPEQVAEEVQLPEELFADLQEQVPEEEAPAAEEPAPEPEFQQQRWTDRQKVPKHVAKLQHNQQEAYEQWLREQEEKGEELPPVLPEETPKKKKKQEKEPVVQEEEVQPKQKKRRVLLPVCIIVVLLALLVTAAAVLILPEKPGTDAEGVHAQGAAAVLLAGTDDTLGRTDMMMLLMMDPDKQALSLVSLPRDTAVSYDEQMVALGSVYGRAGGGAAGLQALGEAVQTCVGFSPDGVLVLHPESVAAFVDALGGTQGMSGEEALQRLRVRKEDEDLDLVRNDTQRQFMAELMAQCATPEGLLKAPVLLDALLDHCVTDLSVRQLLWLARSALLLRDAQAEQAVLPGESEEGVYFLHPEDVVQTVNEICNPYVRAVELADLQILMPDA